MIDVLLRSRTSIRHTRTNDTRQILRAHSIQQSNTPRNSTDQRNSRATKEPERHTDILLLARRARPRDSLDAAVPTLLRRGLAHTGVATLAAFTLVVRVLTSALAVAAAAVGVLLAYVCACPAVGQDTTNGLGCVGFLLGA